MSKRFIIPICLLSALASFAGSTLAVSNSDSWESFDVSAPGGAEIEVQEYNSEWLDSVPYLLEHARWKEDWAFEALADCYRYGKGGVEKNMLNALIFYDEAGGSAINYAERAYESDPYDEFGLMNHIMERLVSEKLSEKEVIYILDDPKVPQAPWIGLLREILSHDTESRASFIESRLGPESSSDEFLVGFVFLSRHKKDTFKDMLFEESDDNLQKLRFIAGKLTPLYEVIADKLWLKCYDVDTRTGDRYRQMAIEYMHLADQAGFLSKTNMARILTYCEENGIDNLPPFSRDDLSRFDVLCPKEYRDYLNDPAVVKEVVVEDEDAVVEEVIVEIEE